MSGVLLRWGGEMPTLQGQMLESTIIYRCGGGSMTVASVPLFAVLIVIRV